MVWVMSFLLYVGLMVLLSRMLMMRTLILIFLKNLDFKDVFVAFSYLKIHIVMHSIWEGLET